MGERRTILFDAAAYDAEVARIEADRSWETATHRAGRLILAGVDLPSAVEGVRVAVTGTDELEVVTAGACQYNPRTPSLLLILPGCR